MWSSNKLCLKLRKKTYSIWKFHKVVENIIKYYVTLIENISVCKWIIIFFKTKRKGYNISIRPKKKKKKKFQASRSLFPSLGYSPTELSSSVQFILLLDQSEVRIPIFQRSSYPLCILFQIMRNYEFDFAIGSAALSIFLDPEDPLFIL